MKAAQSLPVAAAQGPVIGPPDKYVPKVKKRQAFMGQASMTENAAWGNQPVISYSTTTTSNTLSAEDILRNRK